MNSTAEQTHIQEAIEAQPYKKIIAGGSMIEAVGGLGAVVLTIMGLSGILPMELTAVAVICIGASLVFEGGAIGARFSKLLSATGGGAIGAAELGGGITAEFMGGAAGVVLGLLSLLGVAVSILVPVAAIVFGGVLLLGSGVTARLNFMEITSHKIHERAHEVAREAVSAAAGAQVLTGLAAVLLGILALVGINPMTLTLVALLCVATSVVLGGTAISGRIISLIAS